MTSKELVNELSQLKHLNREIEAMQEQQDNLENELFKLQVWKRDTVSGSMLSIPYAKHTVNIGAIVVPIHNQQEYKQTRRQLLDLKAYIRQKKEAYREEYDRLHRLINENITDSLTRQIFTLRYINGLSWKQVAYSIGGGNTEKSVAKTHERELKKLSQMSQRDMLKFMYGSIE